MDGLFVEIQGRGFLFVKCLLEGLFRGFAGHGNNTPDRFHIVFLATEPHTGVRKIVGFCADAMTDGEKVWLQRTRHAFLIPVAQRPALLVKWPGDQGIRRWAKRPRGSSHPALLNEFTRLRSLLPKLAVMP